MYMSTSWQPRSSPVQSFSTLRGTSWRHSCGSQSLRLAGKSSKLAKSTIFGGWRNDLATRSCYGESERDSSLRFINLFQFKRWDFGKFSGYTWFQVPSEDNCIVFGNGVNLPLKSRLNKGGDSIPEVSATGIRALKSASTPASERALVTLAYFSLAAFLPIHVVYSKYLLASTLKRLTRAKQWFRRRQWLVFWPD